MDSRRSRSAVVLPLVRGRRWPRHLSLITIATAERRKPSGNATMRRLIPKTSADGEQLQKFPMLPALERPNLALKMSPG